MKNPYQPIETIIENIISETGTIKTFVLRPKEPLEFKAGQFIELTVPGIGEAPFTPSSSPYVKEKIEVTIMKAGSVTFALHMIQPSSLLGIRGPYGIPYPISSFYGKEILIVGGGVGLAPLRSLLLALFYEADKFKKIVLKYGARTPSDIVFKREIEEWKTRERTEILLTVDVGDSKWRGNVGLITTLLDTPGVDITNAVVIVCGPPIMMKFVTKKLLDLGFKGKDIYLSMERNMNCGIGLCRHCALGSYYVCKDGPVFTWEMIKNIPDPF